MKKILNYIAGEFQPPDSKTFLENYEPATGDIYSEVPDSDKADVAMAVAAAESAFSSWSQLPIAERSRILLKLADLIDEHQDRLAQAESKDTGKPIALARAVDIPRAAANFRFFASAIVNHSSSAHVMEGVAVNYTRQAPLGIVGCISPWNLPLYLFTWKVAPALAMGNCVIGKPSELTPMTAYMLGELATRAGLPPGVLNILHGLGPKVGQAIVEHPRVKAISFTGGTNTGRIIGKLAADQFKKVSLELGGKNPNVIFADCDLEEAIRTSVLSAFRNQGEICLCGSRIIIEASVYEEFKEGFLKQVRELKVGNPYRDDTAFGALISEDHMNKVLGYIHKAREEGGTILVGGGRIHPEDLGGYFVEPTVIEGLDPDCSINQEEVFGPVVSLIPFSSEEEAISVANGTAYGLSCSIWTRDVSRAHRVAHRVQSGVIWVNCWMLRDLRTPFGGMKQSGVGREGGDEALRFFSEPQNICVKQ